MRKKFVKVMFFGALALSTVTYVGCKDYDDDIDNLQTQIDANKADIAKLQSFVDAGKWVKTVEPITGGFKITFNDEKSYEIVNGAKGDKGEIGAEGSAGSKVTIDKETSEWLIDNEPTGWYAKVQDGHSPYIADGKNGDKGYWYFWDSAAGKFVKGDKAQGNDGESITGQNGKSPYIDKTTGQWVYYNEAGEKVFGPVAAGTNGNDAVSPFIGDDGYWYYWDVKQTGEDGTPGKLVKGAYAQTSVYVVKAKDRPAYDLHINVQNADGTFTAKTLALPSAEAIATMDIVSIAGGEISQGMTQAIELYYGVIDKEIEFNGKKFGAKDKKTTLVGSNFNTLFALVNPTSVDFSEYPVTLINSHGEEVFNVSQEKHMSTTPLTTTRATDKWNVGVYALKVSLNPANVTGDLNGKTYAYALKTKDAFSNEIISKYDAKIIAKNEAKSLVAKEVDVDYTKAAELDQLFAGELTKVVDHYYTIDDNELKAIGATFDKATNTISAPAKQGSVNVKVNYLKTDGQKVEGASAVICKVTFTYSIGTDINVAEAAVWTLAKNANTTDMTQNKASITITPESNADLFNLLNKDFGSGRQATLKLDAADVKFAQSINNITYASNSIKLAANQPEKLMKDGKVTGYKITFNFDPTTICATVHNAMLQVMNPASTPALGDNVLKKVNVKVEVKNPGIFEFKPLDAYFTNSNTAVAYGTPANNTVGQDLYALFEVISDADKNHITFSEERPNFGTSANPQYGAAWLSGISSELKVPLYKAEKNDGVYSERKLIISYQPFGNNRLASISKEFNLTVRSAIKQGSHPDIEAKNGKVLSIKETEKSFKIAPNLFAVKDVYAKNVVIAATSRDARVTNVTIELSSEIAKYAEVAGQTSSPVAFGNELTVQLKANTVSIAREITGYALVKITDTWGAVTEVKCPITMKADGAN
ncbi:hypothetical protein [Bacteroides sp.]|uniref:PL29 family lyase N-terminal domain-containing protein n=1 Tax=Bacteroides sp. TaxID=29523 RepID=UPI00260EA35A|nr:hypothetical protein [Bacteroides sp.]MDD3036834.1 hypothetical protein [Bacteroides sp.]